MNEPTNVPAALPDYDDLPIHQGVGLPHAWDVFGPDDDLGTVNLLTHAARRRGRDAIRSGLAINLSLPLTEPNPPLFGRKPLRHTIYNLDRNTLDDSVDSLFPQASSQWDGLRHVRARQFGYYGGVTGDGDTGSFDTGPGRLGIEHWVEHGLAGRGVLLDIAGYLQSHDPGYDALSPVIVTADDLRRTAEHQGLEIAAGDILCLHFGWVEAYRNLDEAGRNAYAANIRHAGLEGSEDMARLLWNWHGAMLACDNPAVEVIPGDPAIGSLHRRILPMLGFALGEMLDFSRLTRELKAAGRWDFMFTAVPLNLPGAIGSPANALAIL